MQCEISRFNYRLSGLICLMCACYQFFCTKFWQSKTIYPVPVYLIISCNYCTNPEPVAQLMKYKVSCALHAVKSYYTLGPCLGGSGPPRKLKKGPPPKRLNLHIFAIGLNSHLTFTYLRRATFLKSGL